MSGLEALKSLTIKSNSIWSTNSGPAWEDVAATLAKASYLSGCYARYKYCLEHKWHNKLVNEIYKKAKELKWN